MYIYLSAAVLVCGAGDSPAEGGARTGELPLPGQWRWGDSYGRVSLTAQGTDSCYAERVRTLPYLLASSVENDYSQY